MRIALAGNPNSGKTTLFNQLTGSNQYVGNWPGVTVERKGGYLKKHKEVEIIDLPGIYSLSPYTMEEEITRRYLIEDAPDAVINIVDGSNLERNLYLTSQLLELGIPVVIAVNMMDLVKKSGDRIHFDKLGDAMGVKAVGISAMHGDNLEALVEAAMEAANAGKAPKPQTFDADIEQALRAIDEQLPDSIPEAQRRWFQIKCFERDELVMKDLSLSSEAKGAMDQIVEKVEAAEDDDSESIITTERYDGIIAMLQSVHEHKSKGKLTLSDKIDKVVTNRWLALPIFVIVMFFVYFLAVHPSGIGTKGTDWVNEQLFGDGWFVVGVGRDAYDEATEAYEIPGLKIEAFEEAAEDQGVDPETATGLTATAEVYDEDGNLTETLTVTHDDYLEASKIEEPDPATFGPWVPGIPELLERGMSAINVNDTLQALVIDGIVAGVGAVLGFLPQLIVLFILLAFLEGCGYMARIAFIMDRIFRRFGLSGKSFIPMLIGSGCSVPGIMASRTIENARDRRMTVMTTSFIPCGAKLPVIALIAGAFFREAWWVGPLSYFIGIAAVIVSGIILKKTRRFAGDPAPFVIELPAYHLPRVRDVARSTFDRGMAFVKRAGTIILLSSIVIWFLSSYGFNPGFGPTEVNDSMLAKIGNAFAWIFIPLGWGAWRPAVAAVTGLVAKENIVGTFGVLYGAREVSETGRQIWGAMAQDFNAAAAMSFLVFNLLCAPCFAAIGAIRREMGSGRWTAFAIIYQTLLAYGASLATFQIMEAVAGRANPVGLTVAIVLIVAALYLLFRPNKYDIDRIDAVPEGA